MIAHDKGESWLLYDRFPINEIDTKHNRFFGLDKIYGEVMLH